MISVTGDTGYFCTVTTQNSFRDLYISINKEAQFPHQQFLMLYETYSLAYIFGWCTDLALMVNMKDRKEPKTSDKECCRIAAWPQTCMVPKLLSI